MKILIITHPNEVANEGEKITQLFREGLEILHLRKPDWDLEKYEELLKKIPPQYYRRVVIHSHYKLVEKYNLKGIHLKSEYLSSVKEPEVKEIFKLAFRKNLSITISMHSFQEIRENKWKFEYVFLSPLFDSISKEGYRSGFAPEEIKIFMKQYKSPMKIIALGGIDDKNVQEVAACGFAGAALLGAIWSEEDSTEKFKKIQGLVTHE